MHVIPASKIVRDGFFFIKQADSKEPARLCEITDNVRSIRFMGDLHVEAFRDYSDYLFVRIHKPSPHGWYLGTKTKFPDAEEEEIPDVEIDD